MNATVRLQTLLFLIVASHWLFIDGLTVFEKFKDQEIQQKAVGFFSKYGNVLPRSVKNPLKHVDFQSFDRSEDSVVKEDANYINKLFTPKRKRRSVTSPCESQNEEHLQGLEQQSIVTPHVFENSSGYSMMSLVWSGKDSQVVLVSLTHEQVDFFRNRHVRQPQLWRSTDAGKHYKLQKEAPYVKASFGLVKHPFKTECVYLTSWIGGEADASNTNIHVSTDKGKTFKQVNLTFAILDRTSFYWNQQDPKRSFLFSTNFELYATSDFGLSWKKIADDVRRAEWSTKQTEKNIVYAMTGEVVLFKDYFSRDVVHDLKRLNVDDATAKSLVKQVYNFDVLGNFLFASVSSGKRSRHIEVTSNAGETWNSAQLPSLHPDQFISVLGVDEGQVFMHVDNGDNNGHGTLYISDSSGFLYTESLKDHFYPGGTDPTDFYKVESMRGVYLAGQMIRDSLIRTVISYNRGASWNLVAKPQTLSGASICHMSQCNLQIHGRFSKQNGLAVDLPASKANAPGLVMVHGVVSDALEKGSPDVYLSRDGGYQWTQVMQGPHYYQIADHGGLLVAVPMTTDKKFTGVKFSVDIGQCWHSPNSSDPDFVVKGLLTEPGSQLMVASLWGYDEQKRWKTLTYDFKTVVTKKCVENDYETFFPHKDVKSDVKLKSEQNGCVLGKKEEIRRVKKNSWCFNGKDFLAESHSTSCSCSMEDYVCDFGYSRNVDSESCEEMQQLSGKDRQICENGLLLELISNGYRKLAGDSCTGGWKPKTAFSNKSIATRCKLTDNTLKTVDHLSDLPAQQRQQEKTSGISSGGVVGLVILALVLVAAAAFGGVVYIRHKREKTSGAFDSEESGPLINDNEYFEDELLSDLQPAHPADSDVEMLA